MRTFHLQRETDVSGISGTGVVAEGVELSDGTVVIRWTAGLHHSRRVAHHRRRPGHPRPRRRHHGGVALMPDRLAVIDQPRAAGVECFTRAEWGSPQKRAGKYAERRGTHPMPPAPADYHFLHITVTADTVLEGAAGARQIETYGYSSPPKVSYQDLVTNEGRYSQGQDYGTKGTHTVNDKGVPGFPTT